MRAISSASVIAAMTRSEPPQRRQTVTSMENTLARSLAQLIRALLAAGGGSDVGARDGRMPSVSNGGTWIGVPGSGWPWSGRMRARRL